MGDEPAVTTADRVPDPEAAGVLPGVRGPGARRRREPALGPDRVRTDRGTRDAGCARDPAAPAPGWPGRGRHAGGRRGDRRQRCGRRRDGRGAGSRRACRRRGRGRSVCPGGRDVPGRAGRLRPDVPRPGPRGHVRPGNRDPRRSDTGRRHGGELGHVLRSPGLAPGRVGGRARPGRVRRAADGRRRGRPPLRAGLRASARHSPERPRDPGGRIVARVGHCAAAARRRRMRRLRRVRVRLPARGEAVGAARAPGAGCPGWRAVPRAGPGGAAPDRTGTGGRGHGRGRTGRRFGHPVHGSGPAGGRRRRRPPHAGPAGGERNRAPCPSDPTSGCTPCL